MFNNVTLHLPETIDKAALLDVDDGLRTHLGASVIGETCMRRVWYGWRWADAESFPGRLARLFERGHKAELVFADLLRRCGSTVYTEDQQGNQFRVSLFGGHLGGSMDGVAYNVPHTGLPPGEPILLEMKTHNAKSYADLLKKKVKVSKPKHYKQAQLYMHLGGLRHCLYLAVNKDTDALYAEMVAYDSTVGEHLVHRGSSVIFGSGTPPRITNNPSWFECTYCPMKTVCHGWSMPRVNCRTCLHSYPQSDGKWYCRRGNSAITTEPKVGCTEHLLHPDLVPWAPALNATHGSDGLVDSITFSARGVPVVNGTGGVPTKDLHLC